MKKSFIIAALSLFAVHHPASAAVVVAPQPCAILVTDTKTGFSWYDDGTVAGKGKLPTASYRSPQLAWAFIETTMRQLTISQKYQLHASLLSAMTRTARFAHLRSGGFLLPFYTPSPTIIRMSEKFLSTQSYKGVRDFYPADMAVQRHIFDTWSKTAERFGFERYDASILEPSDLYKAKGAENEEMVNEQTYTFTDRGEREVTLRPEMTPTVARLVAGKRHELAFPIRWYSIPNLFRYERPQRGRLREHWQLNCDMFGTADFTADVEIIALAYQLLIDFGATPDMFEIRVNDRRLMEQLYAALGVPADKVPLITRLNDRRRKIEPTEYRAALQAITNDEVLTEEVILMLDRSDEQTDIVIGLAELGITNVVFDKSLARGFDYYTGTIFEIFDISGENNRSMLGGGRYDNLTGLFGGEPIPGIGFGMGDVTMRDFLETHNLLPEHVRTTAPTLIIIPMETDFNLAGQKLAAECRAAGIRTTVDIGTKKLGKKIGDAANRGVTFVMVIGEDEIQSSTFKVKNLATATEQSGTLKELTPALLVV